MKTAPLNRLSRNKNFRIGSKEIMEENQTIFGKQKKPYISNHTIYGYAGSENFEHDDNSNLMNYSGCEDEIFNAISEHQDWQEGYDYCKRPA